MTENPYENMAPEKLDQDNNYPIKLAASAWDKGYKFGHDDGVAKTAALVEIARKAAWHLRNLPISSEFMDVALAQALEEAADQIELPETRNE